MAETKPLTPSPFGPKGYVSPEESARIRSNRANAFAESVLSAIRGSVKAVTTDLPGFVMDIADKIAGDAKTFGEFDRSEKMFSAATGTQKKSDQAEMVGSFVNPITAVKAMILPAFLTRDLATVKKARQTLKPGETSAEGIFRLTENVDDGILRTVIDPKQAKFRFSPLAEARQLDEILDFPALFKIVPALRNVKVETIPQSGAYYDHSNRFIGLGDDLGSASREQVLLHEVQHSVQNLLGMNPGASVDEFISSSSRASDVQKMINEAYTEATIAGKYDLSAELIPYDKMLRKMKQQAHTKYLLTAGEAEATAVERMFNSITTNLDTPLEYYGNPRLLIRGATKDNLVDKDVDWDKLISRVIEIQREATKP